jgi:predicted phosphohydrolase
MKIKLLSDLHIEFNKFEIPYDGEDLLILAGDISPQYQDTLELIDTYLGKSRSTQVIFVLGNHDYYGHTLEQVDLAWDNVKRDRLHFLQNNSVVINNVRFYGSTLWTDLNQGDYTSMRICGTYINDFHNIINFIPGTFIATHYRAREAMRKALESSSEPVVVITHHLPSYRSIAPEFFGTPMNAAFACIGMDDLIHHEKVIMWCHGHTHRNLDYLDGMTRVVCNPRGYIKRYRGHVKRENKKFNKHFILNLNLLKNNQEIEKDGEPQTSESL